MSREAFEKWWPSVGQTIGKVAAWEAWQAALQSGEPVVDVFDSLISPAILSFAKGEDELLVRRIWDKVRVAMLSAGKGTV
jgi:hypothetical protein